MIQDKMRGFTHPLKLFTEHHLRVIIVIVTGGTMVSKTDHAIVSLSFALATHFHLQLQSVVRDLKI